MRLIAIKILREAAAKYPDVATQIEDFYQVLKKANWRNLENERALNLAETLANKPELTSEEEQLLELLVALIEKFEAECYPFSHLSTPLSRLAFLMEANNLVESDLIDIFGSKDIISEVFEGKHQISKSQAIQLGERFHLCSSLFLQ